ncbi:RP439 family protein [Candidatus Cardinium hertigii]|uniref:RP439 family protein n=1 Tax=Candidatus Cardinium hertigii TaxID=247481 RepID=UPI003D7D1A9C
MVFTAGCNTFHKYSMNDGHIDPTLALENINTLPVAHMVAQVRSKQLSIKDIQNRLLGLIKNKLEEKTQDDNGETVVQLIINGLKSHCETSKAINNYLNRINVDKIGFPVRSNKTYVQLSMALDWVQSQKEMFITNLRQDKLYRNMSNVVPVDALPTLKSPSDTVFWGNENPSVSTVMLISIAATLGIKPDPINMPAAATVYHFLDPDFELPDSLVPESYPFASQRTMLLIGDYQYGGQRRWYGSDLHNFCSSDLKGQLLLGPEDCSSAVGKATYCTTAQVSSLTTNAIIKSYDQKDNVYHYASVTHLIKGDISDDQLRLINPGDIYVVRGHTAIVASKPDQKGNVITLQFNRDIDTSEGKLSGGGLFPYNLCEPKANDTYFLRKDLTWKESFSLSDFLRKNQEQYEKIFPNGRPTDKLGDCRIFYE